MDGTTGLIALGGVVLGVGIAYVFLRKNNGIVEQAPLYVPLCEEVVVTSGL